MEAYMYSLEKRIKHYSSYQKILLVGEGDFSFALSLCRAFGSAINMVATSRDSRELLMVKYSKAMSNVLELESRGCIVWHEVDVHSMSQHPFMIGLRFDRIIYNFPHAGYLHGPHSSEYKKLQIWCHQNLIRGFFGNARELLTEIGEIHVTHKTTVPFRDWKIVELAQELGLYLVHEERFSKWDYPGYENKRGDGMCDQTFPVGQCNTFMFTKLLYPSTVSGFHLGASVPAPWSGFSGIDAPVPLMQPASAHHLPMQLMSITKGGKSILERPSSAKALADQLAAINEPVSNTDLVWYVIRGLGPDYFMAATSLTMFSRVPSFAELSAALLSLEANQAHMATLAPTPARPSHGPPQSSRYPQQPHCFSNNWHGPTPNNLQLNLLPRAPLASPGMCLAPPPPPPPPMSRPPIQCWACSQYGHIAAHCPQHTRDSDLSQAFAGMHLAQPSDPN